MNTANDDYARFLEGKAVEAPKRGFDPQPMPSHLFPHQVASITHNLQCGSAGLFLDTGLGKTACELEWARQCAETGNGRALILTPLAVARQIEREGKRWGYDIRVIREQGEAREGINVCNYDRLEKLDPASFGAVALDESSVLKSFTGKTTRALISAFSDHRFRLSATATPAPNDHMELGQHAEFCGIMPSNEMLMRWFTADQTEMGRYRLKHHGVTAFWTWMASWCRMATMPSDLGFSDEGFVLPPLHVHRVDVENSKPIDGGDMFSAIVSATDMHAVKRQTADARAEACADAVMGETAEPWVIWCDTDYEADAIMGALHGASGVVEVRGSHTADHKEAALTAFIDGTARILVTKPSVCGFGMNFQHCARTIFAGRSFSYESWYQAVRRFWRYGQKRAVECYVVVAEGEAQIARVIDRKASDHESMKAAMANAMRKSNESSARVRVAYNPNHIARLPEWIKSAA